MSELCLKCGSPGGGYHHMCEECFRSSVTPMELPGLLKMKICSKCSYMVNFTSNQRVVEWGEGIVDLVRENLSLVPGASVTGLDIDRNERDDYLVFLDVHAVIEHLGLEFQEDHSCKLRISYGVCNRCSRQSGNYFEAIIQFRSGKRPLTGDELDFALTHIDKRIEGSNAENAFISHIDHIHKGLDFYIGDRAIARDMARELQHHFGAHFQESFSQAGRKDGKDIYRSTYLVRLLDFRPGDIISYEDGINLLNKVSEKSATITDLSTGRKRNIMERELERLKPVHGDEVEAVVASAEEGEAQVLDPVSFRTVTVLTPRPLQAGGSYRFFRCGEGLFLLPE